MTCVLQFPSRGAIKRRIEVVRANLTFGELSEPRHVIRTRPTSSSLPVVPNLPHGTDGGSRGVERQSVPLAPLTQRMLGRTSNHKVPCKLYAYHLTSESKRISGSNVSAEILQFGRMEDAPNRIREIRLLLGISQQALGDRIGTSKMTISDLERGKMELTLDYMRRIARALNCSPVDILPSQDNPDRLNADERELVRHYRDAPETQRAMIDRLAQPIETDPIQRTAA